MRRNPWLTGMQAGESIFAHTLPRESRRGDRDLQLNRPASASLVKPIEDA
jgi:hypothetical protein